MITVKRTGSVRDQLAAARPWQGVTAILDELHHPEADLVPTAVTQDTALRIATWQSSGSLPTATADASRTPASASRNP